MRAGRLARKAAISWAAVGIAWSLILLGALSTQAFHYPWDQGHAPTDWTDPSDPGPCAGPHCDSCNSTRSLVYIPTGHFLWNETDLVLRGQPTLSLLRTYNSHDARNGMFGNGWIMAGEVGLFQVSASGATQYVLRLANGKRYVYHQREDGTIIPPAGRFDTIEPRANGILHLIDQDQSRQVFDPNGRLLQRIDPYGNVVHYRYDATTGLLSRIADEHGRHMDFGYNSAGRISDVTDHTGRVWSYRYDATGSLIRVTDPLGGVTRYEYTSYQPSGDGHTYYHLTKVIDPTGIVVTEVVYTGERVQSYTVGENVYTYDYNDQTRTVTKTDRLRSRWAYVYNADGLIVHETDPLGHTRAYEYDANGRMTKVTDELNKSWLVAYDALGRKTSESTPLGHMIRFEYGENRPEPMKVISPSGRENVLAYDASGRLTVFRDPGGFETAMEWDGNGRLQAVHNPLGHRTEVTTDAVGRPLVVRDPLQRETKFAYDAVGNLIKIENDLGHAVQFAYDLLDRRTKAIDPSGKETILTYDAAGRITSVTDPAGLVTSYAYDDYGRSRARRAADGRVRIITYRSDNLLDQVRLEDGTVVTYDYDRGKRVTRKMVGDEQITYGYDARDFLTRAANRTDTVTLGYDDDGRLVTETVNGQTITSTWSVESEITAIATTGYTATYTRDLRGLITRIDASTGIYEYAYDDAGRRTELRQPNGATVEYVYDVANQLTRLVHRGPFTATYTYDYDEQGFITRWQGNGFDWRYAYNTDQELGRATRGDEVFAYAYDPAGNQTGNGRTYDAANRLTEDNTYTYRYDAAGNLTRKTHKATGARTGYTWNSLRQLTQVARSPDGATSPDHMVTYTYDPLGRRSSRTADDITERYVYDRGERILTLNASGTVTRAVTFGTTIDEPLGASGAEGTHFYHANHLGSIMALTNDRGAVVTRYDYTPYGQTTETIATANPFRFTAREYEAEDLYYYRARYYDPTLGRFLSEDPLGFSSGETNLYRYTGGNPVNLTDPSGEIIPALIAIWTGVEIGLALYDAYDTATTLLDPCASGSEKAFAGGLFIVGALLPGGGYSALDDVGKAAVRSCCCFREGTLVTTQAGLKPIERVVLGEFLAAQDQETGETAWKPVTALHVTEGKPLYALSLSNTAGQDETVFVTDNHPYRVKDLGWVDSGRLQTGMQVESRSGEWLTVTRLEPTNAAPTTYNLTVADDHSYFVGKHEALVHNCGCLKGPIGVDEALDLADDFLLHGVPIRSIDGKTGVQFIQQTTDAQGRRITKRIGFDLNPGSKHVQQSGPHLNLQTQIDGVVQGGSLADPHIPIDPSTIRKGDY